MGLSFIPYVVVCVFIHPIRGRRGHRVALALWSLVVHWRGLLYSSARVAGMGVRSRAMEVGALGLVLLGLAASHLAAAEVFSAVTPAFVWSDLRYGFAADGLCYRLVFFLFSLLRFGVLGGEIWIRFGNLRLGLRVFDSISTCLMQP